jgi:hypothetical protein
MAADPEKHRCVFCGLSIDNNVSHILFLLAGRLVFVLLGRGLILKTSKQFVGEQGLGSWNKRDNVERELPSWMIPFEVLMQEIDPILEVSRQHRDVLGSRRNNRLLCWLFRGTWHLVRAWHTIILTLPLVWRLRAWIRIVGWWLREAIDMVPTKRKP